MSWGRLSWKARALSCCLFGFVLTTFGVSTLLYTEHAVVTIAIPARSVAVKNVVLNGGSEGIALRTTPLTVSVTEKQTGTSSITRVPANIAAGYVTFWCSPMTSCPNGYTVQAGTILESISGVRYRTMSSADFPSCAPSSPVAISAITPGSAGNAGAGAVTFGQFPGYIHVTNQGAVTGGTNARAVAAVTQADLDSVRNALSAKVSSELATQLAAEAGGRTYFAAASPQFTVTTDAHAGDQVPAFTVSVAGTLSATAFSASDAQAALRRALVRQVPSGFRLLSGPLDAVYSAQDTMIAGSASGFAVPALDAKAVTARIRGASPTTAESWLSGQVPGASVRIQTAPLAMPWLPLLDDHISIQIVVQPAP